MPKDYHKVKNLSFRFKSEVIEMLKELAQSENRSMSNWMENVIIESHRQKFNNQALKLDGETGEYKVK